MNIFYLHKDPVEAAKLQYNKHVVKMILETAQMLCTAHHEIMGEDADVPYKRAHVNHPSTIWCRRSAENYAWLYKHFEAYLTNTLNDMVKCTCLTLSVNLI